MGPGLSGQLVEGLLDLEFQNNFPDEYRKGFTGDVSRSTLQAFQDFANRVQLVLREMALDPANADMVAWDNYYLKGHPFVTKQDQQAQRDRAESLRQNQRGLEDALLNPRDQAAPELDLVPVTPKPADVVDMDASAPLFVEEMLEKMGTYSYEVYMECSGDGGTPREFSPMFSDPSKALKAVAKTAEVKRAFDRIQTLMQNDFSASVEAEKESRIQGAYEDVVEGTLVRILKAYGRDLKKLERDVDGVKDLMRGLDLLRRGAYSALSKSSLAKVVKMSEDLASTAESLVEGLEDRTHYRMLEDLPSDLEEVAWTFSNFLREHF